MTRAAHDPGGKWEIIGPLECPVFYRWTLYSGRDAVCPACLDTGHVCENHPDHPWAELAGGVECCGGAGMPCPRCCSPIPMDGTTSIVVAFTPDRLR